MVNFIFSLRDFITYYSDPNNLVVVGAPVNYSVFNRNRSTGFVWKKTLYTGQLMHMYLKNLFIKVDRENDYVYFTMVVNHNNQLYGDHFSIGKKDINVKTKRQLVDIHFSTQVPSKGLSEKDETKCFLYDGKPIDVSSFRETMCEIPRNKLITNTYNNLFLDYLLVILATPFVTKSDLKEPLQRILSINAQSQQPPSSPVGGSSRKKIYIGVRGGRYTIVNGKRRYVSAEK